MNHLLKYYLSYTTFIRLWTPTFCMFICNITVEKQPQMTTWEDWFIVWPSIMQAKWPLLRLQWILIFSNSVCTMSSFIVLLGWSIDLFTFLLSIQWYLYWWVCWKHTSTFRNIGESKKLNLLWLVLFQDHILVTYCYEFKSECEIKKK